MTHRVELLKECFWKKVKKTKCWTLWMTHRVELFLNTTQRIEPFFFCEYDAKNWTLFFWIDAKNWTLFEHDSKELNLFLSMIQRIESLSEYDSKKSNFSFWIRLNESNPFFWMWLKLNFLVEKIVKTVKIVFFTWLEESDPLFSIWLKELNLFRFDSKIWFYSVWPQELIFFFVNKTDRIGPFFLNMTQRIEFFFVFLHVSQNWTFFKNDAENWTLFSLKMTQRIEPFFSLCVTQRIELFFYHDSKELNFNKKMIQILEPSFEFDSKKWTFLNITQRIEPFF